MALNFPSAPNVGDVYQRWTWNGVSWVSTPTVSVAMLPLTGGTLSGPGNLTVNGHTTLSTVDVNNAAAFANGVTIQGDDVATETYVDDAVDAVKNLGHYVGAFATYAAVPTNASSFPQAMSVNDFITVRADENNSDATTRYVLANIASDGTLTWDYDITYSTDVSGKMDLVTGATAGTLATFNASGQVQAGDAPTDGRTYARRNDAWQTPPMYSSERDWNLPRTNMLKIRKRNLVQQAAGGNVEFRYNAGTDPRYMFLAHGNIGNISRYADHPIRAIKGLPNALVGGWLQTDVKRTWMPTARGNISNYWSTTNHFIIDLNQIKNANVGWGSNWAKPDYYWRMQPATAPQIVRILIHIRTPWMRGLQSTDRRVYRATAVFDFYNINQNCRWVNSKGWNDAVALTQREGIGIFVDGHITGSPKCLVAHMTSDATNMANPSRKVLIVEVMGAAQYNLVMVRIYTLGEGFVSDAS